MLKKLDLSILILNYNTKDLLADCLKSIKKAKPNHYTTEVIVIDNASTDGSPQMVEEKFPWVKLVTSRKNLGFAKGNNLGIPESSGRYILFLNPDTIVFPEVLDGMIDFMDKHPKAGVSTCKVELPNGNLDEACHRGFPNPWNAFCHFSGLERLFSKSQIFSGYYLGWLPLAKTHEIDACVGAFLLVRREVGEQINWWDEDYFWYGEDIDFCYRVKEIGFKVYCVPEYKIIHYKGASSGIKKQSESISTASRETKIRSAKASTQAMRIFYQKHYFTKYPKLLTWLVMGGINLLEKRRLKGIK